ncbi:hypothetical protein DICVIV_05719, partial [Dictyocaulus viviparus]
MPPKKAGKKNKDDNWDDELIEQKLASLMTKKVANEVDWDAESDEESVKQEKPAPRKAAFSMLMADSDEEKNASSHSDTEKDVTEKIPYEKEKKQENICVKHDIKKKGKKGKKVKHEVEDDLDAILATLEYDHKVVPADKSRKTDEKKEKSDLGFVAEACKEQKVQQIENEEALELSKTAEVVVEHTKKKKKVKDRKETNTRDNDQNIKEEENVKNDNEVHDCGDVDEAGGDGDEIKD